MGKNMRDLDKIREDYEFHFGSSQVKLLLAAAVAICLLVFVLGFLVGRHFGVEPSPKAYVSRVSPSSSGPELKEEPKDEARGPGYGFFEELSQEAPGIEAPAKKAAPLPDSVDLEKPSIEHPSSGENVLQGKEMPATVSTPATIPSKYTIQVGAFEDSSGAENLASRLRRQGYPSYVLVKAVPGKGTWHRVRVGEYTDRPEAERTMRLLEEREGLSTFITLYSR